MDNRTCRESTPSAGPPPAWAIISPETPKLLFRLRAMSVSTMTPWALWVSWPTRTTTASHPLMAVRALSFQTWFGYD